MSAGQESPEFLREILAATSQLLADPKLATVLQRAFELASRVLPSDAHAIWRANSDLTSWYTLASVGLSGDYSFSVESKPEISRNLQAVVAEDVKAMPMLSRRTDVYEREGIVSLLVVPLLFGGEPRGTLCFYFRAKHSFTEQEIERATLVASLVGPAIATAELYEEQIAERHRADFLANAGEVLSSSLDYEATLKRVAELAVPEIADWCTVSTYFDGDLRNVAVAHQDRAKLLLAEEFRRRYPETVRPGSPVERILVEGKSELYPVIPDELLTQAAVDADHLRMLRELGVKSAIMVPIAARGGVIGVLRLISAESGRIFTERDLKVAEDLGRRAGVAIENARLHHAIRTSEERFRGIFENASVPMVVTNLDGTFIRANESYCRLTGYTEEELRGTAFHKLTHPDDLEANMALYRQLVAGEIPSFTIEKRYFRKDGNIVWVRAGASVLRDSGGSPLHVVGIAVDVTARREAEADRSALLSALESDRGELRAAVEQLRLVEASLNAGTWYWDVQTGISHWPAGISALWGLPKKEHEIAFEDFVRRLHPEDRDRVLKTITDSLEKYGTYEVEFRVIWPDESVHWLSARGAIVTDEHGAPTRVVGIALEVTERVKTQEALRQSEKLAAAGRLAATIAHEINNPLEAVTNLLFVCLSDPRIPPPIREYLSQADQELSRVSHIARQTLGFYRDTSQPQRVNIGETVEQIARLYAKRIEAKSIRFGMRLEPDALVFGKIGDLRQVVSNVMLNAIDAVAIGGAIEVRVRSNDRTGYVRLTIADNGGGITPENRSKLFQPFFTTKKDVGTGLGLWVSKGIIEKHFGKLTVRSRAGGPKSGTIFAIDLPIAASMQVATPAA